MNQNVIAPKTCGNCGARLLPDAARCEYCRQPVVWDTAPAERARAWTPKGVTLVALVAAGVASAVVVVVGLNLVNALKGASPTSTSSAPARNPDPLPTPPTVPSPPVPVETPLASASRDADAGGYLSREVIRTIMRRSYSALRACYERGLARNPNLRGKVTVHFVIGLDGSVTSATTPGSTLTDKAVLECIASRVKATTFPSPQGGTVTVTYPIAFESK
ncbi:MAG: AgmX/PglI C-terminal domain-containing protein [Polyangiaceae bacterium]|nr:AgmX/PglI C-terminal domain-containing protein [Polyangiaceae bacterium]